MKPLQIFNCIHATNQYFYKLLNFLLQNGVCKRLTLFSFTQNCNTIYFCQYYYF
uniref:Uncharacterized protein n=1 Tax=Anguilla anguilla TaxID=7936 RepID=A0A0E9R9E8_ANGAN